MRITLAGKHEYHTREADGFSRMAVLNIMAEVCPYTQTEDETDEQFTTRRQAWFSDAIEAFDENLVGPLFKAIMRPIGNAPAVTEVLRSFETGANNPTMAEDYISIRKAIDFFFKNFVGKIEPPNNAKPHSKPSQGRPTKKAMTLASTSRPKRKTTSPT